MNSFIAAARVVSWIRKATSIVFSRGCHSVSVLTACIGLWAVGSTAHVAWAEPPLAALTFAPDAQHLLTGSQAGVSLLDWPSQQRVRELVPPFANVHDIGFSPDGQLLAVAGGDPADVGTVQIFSWPELQLQQTLLGHDDSVMAIAWLSDSTIAAAGLDQRITLWDVATGDLQQILHGHSRGITALAYVPEGQLLVSAGIDQSLRVWELQTGNLRHSLTIHTQSIQALETRPAGSGLPMVASCSDDRTVRFWQPSIGRMVRFIRLPAKPLCICWLANGASIAAGCDDGSVYVIDPLTVQIVAQHQPSRPGWIYALAATTQGDQLVAGGSDGLRVINSSTLSLNQD